MSVCTCLTHRVFEAKNESYWKSYSGLLRRIDGLAQDFNFKLVNNAVKIVAPTNGAQWLKWVVVDDDRLCPTCMNYSESGRSGFFNVTWFQPAMPVHQNCRCEWEILFYDPFA